MKTKSIDFANIAIEGGCPYVLHWQLYDNEFENGEYNGFWLIDNHGVKQPFYFALKDYFSAARSYVKSQEQKTGSVPDAESFRTRAVQALEKIK